MKVNLSRREALRNLGLAAGTLLVARGAVAAAADKSPAGAGALPHLTATDPTAVALAYHESAKNVDPAKFPTFKPEQKCSNCLQLKGNDGETWRPCTLFVGKLVNADGWCRVYVKKT